MTITLEDVKDNLLTMEQVVTALEPTEGLTAYPFESDGSTQVEFSFPADWNAGLKDQDGLFVTAATVRVGEIERPMTKDAALEISSLYSIPKEYAMKLPGEMHTAQMNHWGSHTLKGKARSLKMLASSETAMGFSTESKAVFSNLALLDEAVAAVKTQYGQDVAIYFDKKFHHDLKKTSIRLITPEGFLMPSKRAEVSGKDDEWYGGIHIANSIVGENPTQMDGFMFAWWCKNGATTSHTLSSRHKRKAGEDLTEVYTWAAGVAEDIVTEIKNEMSAVASLTKIPLLLEEGELVQTLHNVYDHYKVPVTVRQAIQDNMTESEDLTAYGLMQAITATANDPDLGWKQIEDIMRIGGDISHAMSERCSHCKKF